MNQGNPPTSLAPEPGGQGKEVGWFRQIVKNLRERTVRVGPGLRVSYKSDGTLIELARMPSGGKGGDPTGCKRCKITSITPTGTNSANYLTTQEYNPDGYTVSATVLKVAIPYFLRASTYESLSLGGFNYVKSFATGGQIRCSQTGNAGYVVKSFFPPYAVGQDIYAIQPIGKTDVTVDDILLEWVDANVEGRRLDTAQIDLNYCVDVGGTIVRKKVTVEGGPVFPP